jgi:outer membrane protein TolC
MNRLLIVLFSLVSFSFVGTAQPKDGLHITLVEAIHYAVANNPQLKSTQLNEEINQFKIKEVRSSALPQISGSGTATDNFLRATQLLPGEIMGQPGKVLPVQMGNRFVYGGSIQLSQKLFDPSMNIGLKAAKESQGLYELQTFASKEELIFNIIDAYMQLSVIEKQQALVEGNIDRMKQLINITNIQYKEGIIKKVDVDQLNVDFINLRTQLSNTENTIEQLLNTLKILMNVDVDQPIKITEVGAQALSITAQLQLSANTELGILEKQIQLQQLDIENIKAGYMPSLSLGANFGRQWQTSQLFHGPSTSGFSAGSYSLNLSIPIFDGNAKKNQIAQSNIALKQLHLNKEHLTKSIKNQFRTAQNTLTQNQRVLQAQIQNIRVAEELYGVAKLSYTEGITPLTELINAETSLREAQSQYLTALLQTNISELNMMRISGQLSQLIQGRSITK